MILSFTYNGELDNEIKLIVETNYYYSDYIYTVKLSEIVCKSIYNEDYLTIKQIVRTLKIEKISKTNINSNDYMFLDFFIDNIEKINLLEIEYEK